MAMHVTALFASLWIAAAPEVERRETAEPYLQRFGYEQIDGNFDYDPATNRMVTRHDHRVALWDLGTGLAVREFSTSEIPSNVAFAAEGRSVLVATGSSLTIFDVASGTVQRVLPAPPSQIHDAAISPDGRYVAAGCYDTTVWLWDARTGELVWRGPEHSGHVNFVRFSPDGKRLLTGGFTRTAILWEVPTGKVLRRFPLSSTLAWGEFSPDGQRLVTVGTGMGTGPARVVIWDIATREPLDALRRSARAAWFTDERLAVLEHSRKLTFVNLNGKQQPRTVIPGGLQPGGRVALAKNGWQLRIPKGDGAIVLAAPDGSSQPLSLPRYGARTQRPLDVSPDGKRLLTAFFERREQKVLRGVELWELDPPRPVKSFEEGPARFHPDGRRLLAGKGRLLTLYDLETLKLVTTFQIETGGFESVQFLDDGRRLLTAGGDWYDGNEGHILLWDVETGKQIRSLGTSEQAAYYAAMTPDQDLLAATFTFGEGGNIDFARILDTRSGRELQRIDRKTHRLRGFTLGPLGKRVAAYEHGQTSVWESRRWKLAYGVPGVVGSFNSDSSLLATRTAAGGMHLWAARDGAHLRSYSTSPAQPTAAVFHPGGATLFLGGERGLELWDLRRKKPIARLATFGGTDEWLATTSNGPVAGTKAALERITWRDAADDRIDMLRNPRRVAELTNPGAVGEILTRSLPPGESLVKDLSADPEPMPESLNPRASADERPALALRNSGQPSCAGLAGDAEARLLLVSHENAPAVLWRLRPAGVVARFPACEGGASVALTPDGALAVVEGPLRGVLSIWDSRTGRYLRQLSMATEKRHYDVLHLSVHPDNRSLAAVYVRRKDDSKSELSERGEVVIWDLLSGEVQRRLNDDSARRMQSVAFTPDGSRLLIGYSFPNGWQHGTAWDAAELWDWKAERKVKTYKLSGYDADHPAFSADGKRLLLGEGWAVTVRSFPDGALLARVRHENGQGAEAGVLTADGRTLVAGTLGKGRLIRTDVATPQNHVRSPGLKRDLWKYPRDLWIGGAQNLVFSPGADGRVFVHRLSDMRKVAELATRGQGEWLVWTAAGYYECSDDAQAHLSWQYASRPYPLERFAQWTKLPDRVAEVLSGKDVPAVEFPADALPATTPVGPPKPPQADPWSEDRKAEADAIELARNAEAELRFNNHDRLTFAKFEGRQLAGPLLRAISALRSVDRLYLADTNIRDEHLRGVGLMTFVKRLSLWGTPITDRGLAQLSGMWRLEVLDVHDTTVTEASLRKLRHIETLRTLIVPKGIDAEKLRSAMGRPDLEIIPRTPPPKPAPTSQPPDEET